MSAVESQLVEITGVGFRWSKPEHHRDDESDRQHMTPEPDGPYLSKFDWTAPPLSHPETNAGWVLDLLPITATQHALATPGGTGPAYNASPLIGGWLPCCTVGWRPGTQPSDDTIIPPVAAVPLAGTLPLLIAALVSLAILQRKRR